MITLSKRLFSIPIVLALATVACAATGSEQAGDDGEPAAGELTTQRSYAIGWQAGSAFAQQGIELDEDGFLEGLRAAMAGGELKWTEEEMMATLQELQREMVEKQRAGQEEMAAVNQKAGEDFLAENGQRDGVTTTESGLQYEVITGGDGPSPGPTDTVTVNYRGTLIDGTEFDSSYSRGVPATFPLNQVIAGWTEGLQLMSVGSKWKLYVPSQLGYGARAAGPKIGPNSTLIFEVELLDVAGSSQ